MRLAFFGTAGFAVPTLRALLDSPHEVALVVTGPDKPAGRGRKLSPTPVRAFAEQSRPRPEVWTPPGPRDPEFISRFRRLQLDAAVVVAYRILPPEVFDHPDYGTLNVHPSLLPKYRGPAPIPWAIIRGEAETGVSIIRISERVDAGGVVLQRTAAIGPDETAGELADRLAPVGGEMVLEALDGLKSGVLEPIPQDDAEATKAPKLSKEDGRIDWGRPAAEVHSRVRGVTPWPGAFSVLPDGKTLKLFRTRVVDDRAEAVGAESAQPGRLMQAGPDSLVVACGEGALRVGEVQLQGKKKMPVSDFVKGYRLEEGVQLGEQRR